MAIFPVSTASSSNDLAVDVPPFVVWASLLTPNADPTKPPTYGNWTAQPLLQVLGVFKSSSPGGQSYAKVRGAPGAPVTSSSLLTEGAVTIGQGDRVLIGLDEGGDTPRWLFGGYVVRAQLNISAEAEAEILRVAGPEWIWGERAGAGALKTVCGQLRRLPAAETPMWLGTPADVSTGYSNQAQLTDFRAVFNPAGRKNMSKWNVQLSTNTATIASGILTGRPWETEDRKGNGSDMADTWTKDQAVLSLYLWYNDPNATGITLDDSVLPTGKPLKQLDVDGVGLYEALRQVCGPEWAFQVDCTPDTSAATSNNSFQGFKLRFYDRTTGPTANLVLNPMGTAPSSASMCVSRLQASKDASKIVNKVRVLAKYLRHVKLQYVGAKTKNGTTTPYSATVQNKLLLQHGWDSTVDDDLKFYAKKNTAGQWTVDLGTIDAYGDTARQHWVDNYTRKGKNHAANQHVFRLFTWNEAAEKSGTGPTYGPPDGTTGAGRAVSWFAPDLSGIADDPADSAKAGKYSRRRRKLLDTAYFDSSIDSWRRVRPTLYIKGWPPGGGSADTAKWYQVPTNYYLLDAERAAVWITHEDIAQWHPFLDANNPEDHSADQGVQDDRTFATLLHTGDLRMLLECSVEVDWNKEYKSDVTAAAGISLIREAVIRADQDYYYTQDFADGVTSPSGNTLSPRDDSTAAQEYADNAKLAGQDQITHSSILVEADWPEQPIGSMVTSTTGRAINLTVGGTGKGCQIVAMHLDPSSMKWELLTETAALKLRDVDRRKINKHRNRRSELWGQVHGQQAAQQSGPTADGLAHSNAERHRYQGASYSPIDPRHQWSNGTAAREGME